MHFPRALFSVKLRQLERRMSNPIKRYTHWLHTCWPAGVVEKLPESGELGVTNIPGVRIVGDLTGIPLLKFSSKTGAEAVRAILAEPDFREGWTALDLAIVGGRGVGGLGRDRSEESGAEFQNLRGDAAVFDRGQFPQGETDLHLPDRS